MRRLLGRSATLELLASFESKSHAAQAIGHEDTGYRKHALHCEGWASHAKGARIFDQFYRRPYGFIFKVCADCIQGMRRA